MESEYLLGSRYSRVWPSDLRPHLLVLALSVTVRNRVRLTAAKTNDTLDPLKVSISLALIRIRHESLLGISCASIDDVTLNTANIRLADNDTVVTLGDREGERLRLAGRPGLGVVDAQRSSQDVLDQRNAETRADFEGVGDGVAVGHTDGRLGAAEAADDGGHGDVPVDKLLVGKDLDLGAVLAIAALDIFLGGASDVLDSRGSLKSLQVGGLHDLRSSVGLENDDVVRRENLGSSCRLRDGSDAQKCKNSGGDHDD